MPATSGRSKRLVPSFLPTFVSASSAFAEAMAKRGVKGTVLERREIRAVLVSVFSRADDPEVKESIKAAIHVFADEPGT